MTAQIAERLRYDGEDYAMCTNPLSDYFALGGVNPDFVWTTTALWRGYVGYWEVADGRLYLLELQGTLKDGNDASVATIFPNFPDRVFAQGLSQRGVRVLFPSPSGGRCPPLWRADEGESRSAGIHPHPSAFGGHLPPRGKEA